MADIDLTYNVSTYTNQVIVIWYSNAQPTVEIGRKVIDGIVVPKVGSIQIQSLINGVKYLFRYYESTNGTTLGPQIAFDFVIAGKDRPLLYTYNYVVGRGYSGGTPGAGDYWEDPDDGTTDLLDERLNGATGTDLAVDVEGVPPTTYPDKFTLIAKGIRLLTQQFIDGASVRVIYATSGRPATVTPSVGGEAFNIITEGEQFAAKHYGKNNLAHTSAIQTITFDSFQLIPAETWAKFSTYALLNKQFLILQFATGDSVRYAGKDRNRIVLGASEKIGLRFYIDGSDIKCDVFDDSTAYGRIGQLTNGNEELLNTIKCDLSGAEYDLSDYPRLFDELPTGLIVQYGSSVGQYDQQVIEMRSGIGYPYFPNRGKFAVNQASGKFKLPWFTGYLKFGSENESTDRLGVGVNSVQANANQKHYHLVATNGSSTTQAEPVKALRRNNVNSDGYFVGDIAGQPLIQFEGRDKLNPDNILNLMLWII